jgi:hypothetical protein
MSNINLLQTLSTYKTLINSSISSEDKNIIKPIMYKLLPHLQLCVNCQNQTGGGNIHEVINNIPNQFNNVERRNIKSVIKNIAKKYENVKQEYNLNGGESSKTEFTVIGGVLLVIIAILYFVTFPQKLNNLFTLNIADTLSSIFKWSDGLLDGLKRFMPEIKGLSTLLSTFSDNNMAGGGTIPTLDDLILSQQGVSNDKLKINYNY